MKQSIPLKEIVGFLPYGLTGICTDENQGIETVNGISWNDKKSIIELNTNIDAIDIVGFKPIVRPLSDLTKEITYNGETFVPTEELNETHTYFGSFKKMVEGIYENQKTNDNPQWIVDKLHEWHFDVYDWIKDGKAIDINSI